VLAAAAKSSNPDVLGPLFPASPSSGRFGCSSPWSAPGKVAWRIYELRRLSRSGIAEVDRMDGTTFEVFLTTLFRRLGYGVEHTGRRGDYGADLVVTKDGQRIAVQAKRWTKTVGVKAVQEAVASKGIYKCADALVVANRSFRRQARTLAEANHVKLWDRDVLMAKLLAVGNGSTDATPVAENDVPTRPVTAEPTVREARCRRRRRHSQLRDVRRKRFGEGARLLLSATKALRRTHLLLPAPTTTTTDRGRGSAAVVPVSERRP
jgi:restriction system protein